VILLVALRQLRRDWPDTCLRLQTGQRRARHPDYRGSLGEFDTAEAALAAAKKLVDDYLDSANTPGMTADALLANYRMFGEDPFIVGAGSDFSAPIINFSAWEYARTRCGDICVKS
jgi:hypothetical protein